MSVQIVVYWNKFQVKMEFIEDFTVIQSTLTSIQSIIGDFTSIRHVGGNEAKISKVVDELSYLLSHKKIFKVGKINKKYEMKLRKINFLLILNTDFYNRSKLTNNGVAHLLDIMPQLSKCLLTNVIIKLGMSQFYAEAICSLPVEISLELLENCSKIIQKSNPYDILQQTSQIAQAIYYKIYHLRYESVNKIDLFIVKLLERFGEILKNYINPVTEQILSWPTVKMYQYMGRTILHILQLLKSCFEVFFAKEYVADYFMFYQASPEKSNLAVSSQKMLNKSNETLYECNKSLMTVCESNVVAVTIDVFCSWTECKHDDTQLQQAIGTLAYDVSLYLQKFEDCGDLPMMLSAITVKPKSITEIIEAADEQILLEQVVIQNENQVLWFKALLNYGILKSERSFDTFKSVIELCVSEDYLKLLQLASETNNDELKEVLLQRIAQMPEADSIKVINEYFSNAGINNNYEMKEFDLQMQELFNKLNCDNKNEIPLKEISVLLLQNPVKFLTRLLGESLKNSDHVSIMIQIYNFVKPVCNIQQEGKQNSIFFDIIVDKLREFIFETMAENCMIELMKKLVESELLNHEILIKLWEIVEESTKNNDLQKAAFICRLYKALPDLLLKNVDIASLIIKLATLSSKMRWNFFTYSEEKRVLVNDILHLIAVCKTHLPDNLNVDLKNFAEKLDNRIDAYHIIPEHTRESNNYLSYISVGYDKDANHNEQVCRLLKVLPSCVPEEWELCANYLIINHENSLDILQLYIDLIMILSEMSKKSCDTHGLSYCFQQVCVVIKDFIYPLIKTDKEKEKTFIKTICRLIKHLPSELHNSVEVSLVNLFNFEVLKSMKEDEEFLYNLVSISDLHICKIICSKMT
ncbi:hypothetical protein CBL_00435 [Carabus blaptoides fortunei]